DSVTGDDEFVSGIGADIGRLAIDKVRLVQSEPWPRVPTLSAGTAGLMTLDAVHCEIRACAKLETVGAVGGSRKCRQGLRRGNRGIEVTCQTEKRKLVADEAVHVGGLV